MKYYVIIMISSLLFAGQFLFSKRFQQEYGNSIESSMLFAVGNSIVASALMLIIETVSSGRISLEIMPQSLLLAFFMAVFTVSSFYCNLRALSRTNLSVYSMFCMLGGMIFPSCIGILFYNEEVTVQKIVCLILIIAALLLTIEKSEKSDSVNKYCIAVGVLNGMISSTFVIHQSLDRHVSNTSFLVCYSMIAVIIALAIMIKKRPKRLPNKKEVGCMIGYGVSNSMGNLLLMIALMVLPASVQYPFSTGGVIIASTLISVLIGERIKIKTFVAVFITIVALTIVAM